MEVKIVLTSRNEQCLCFDIILTDLVHFLVLFVPCLYDLFISDK